MEEHAQKLERIFQRLEQANFKVQPEKCVFAADTVEYLGHIVTKEGVRPDPRKIKAIEEYPPPRTVTEVRAFIGLVGYYRRHVRNFAELAKLLTKLTKKNEPFDWGPEQQKAFDALRKVLSYEPRLIYPDFSRPFIVACDASTKAIGAILSQEQDGGERPVAYCSRQLNHAESKYSITELELLALLFAVKQFRCYLYGRQFKVYTDHRALKWLLSLTDPSSRLTRWSIKLADYDFVVEPRANSRMRHANALSRCVNTVTGEYVLTREVMKAEQDQDPMCQIYKAREEFWVDETELLYHKEEGNHLCVVVPKSLVATVLKCYHELPFTAHQGIARTIAAIKRKYWREALSKDVREYINACEACAERKTGKRATAPLGDSLEANEFLEVVSLDVVGPLPVTDNGNRYLLTFVDHFTRFCEAIPIPTQETEVIAREFVTRIITQFGVPRKLLTDRGASFTSALMKKTCRLLKIQMLQTSSYNAQANGVCERMHKLLVDMISHFVNKDARNWDRYVPYAVMAYRATPHCTVKYSPYYLVYGRELRLPIEDDWRPQSKTQVDPETDYETHVPELAGRLQEAQEEARRQSKLSHDKAKKYYDKGTRDVQLKKGDRVYLHNPIAKRSRARKVAYQYQGPYVILEKISPLKYKLQVDDDRSIIVYVNRLKWLIRARPS
jgi:transposase InsO family protein